MKRDVHFGRDAPLVLEIGFGDGRYLAHLARARPEWDLLGVEMSMGSVWRAYRRMKRQSVTNVRLFHGNARFIVRDVLPPGSLHGMYVNFPDPWPRKKHHARRLLCADFLELAATALEPGATLALTTDHGEYYEFAIEETARTGLFDIERTSPGEEELRTKYALKWREERKAIHHVLFHNRSADRPRVAAIETVDMQHAVLSGSLDAAGTFKKLVRPFRGGHVIVLEAFRSMEGDGLLFKVLVEEEDLRQELIIQAWQRADGVYVGLEPFGDPLGTRGVREAVRTVSEWLIGQGLEMRQSWF